MRRIATMVVLVSVVVATVAAGPASAAYLTAGAPVLHSVDGSAQMDSSQNDAAGDGNLSATGYELADAKLGSDERLHATVEFEKEGDGAASAPLTMTLDGERHRLGSVAVDDGQIDVDVDEDAESIVIEIECEWIDSDDDGWAVGDTLDCDIYVGATALAAGDNDVGFNDLEASTVTVEEDAGQDANLTATGYEIEDAELGQDERLHATVTYEKEGDGEASAPLTMSVDGERHRLGTVAVDGDQVNVDVDDDDRAAIFYVEIDCWWEDRDGDGYRETLVCEITIRYTALAAGDHDVGFNGLEPSAVQVRENVAQQDANLTATDFEVEDRSLAPGESTDAKVVFESDGEGPASAPLTMTLDGERHRLGTVETDGEHVEVEPSDGAAQQVVSGMHCIWVDVDEDPYKELVCFIVFAPATLAGGDHDVGFNDLEPTSVAVERPSPASGAMLVGDVWGPPCPDIPPGSPGPTIPIPGCDDSPLPW